MFFRSKIVNNKKSNIKYPHDAAVASTDMKRLSLVALAASLASVQSEGLDIDAVNPKIVEAQ